MSIDQVADVIPVRHRFVTATRSVDVGRVVPGAVVTVGAGVWVIAIHFDDMLIHVVAVGVMQVSVMQVVDVPIVLDGRVPAVGAVNMIVIRVFLAVAHD